MPVSFDSQPHPGLAPRAARLVGAVILAGAYAALLLTVRTLLAR